MRDTIITICAGIMLTFWLLPNPSDLEPTSKPEITTQQPLDTISKPIIK